MRRFVMYRLLAAAALVAFGIGIVLLSRLDFSPTTSPPVIFTDLAAPLPADFVAEYAAALPAIDDLRHQRGSLLDGTLLESSPAASSSSDHDYVQLLRREARRLEDLAADEEENEMWSRADDLRYQAAHLRQQARTLVEGMPRFTRVTNR